jgi:predicted amidophosphoribosyltransferase
MKTLDRRGGKEQKRLSRKERFLNMKDVYTPKKGVLLHGKRVIVVDDITTSGATLLAVVSALRRVGARGVRVAVLGATPLRERSTPQNRR